MNRGKKPLYRKVNTKARGVHHHFGGDYKKSRHKKRDTTDQVKGTMHGKKMRGLDYTPLFRFLLSKVGKDWNEVYSEAKSRLYKADPIFWLVALDKDDRMDCVRVGESTYFSGLFVDSNGILQLSNPDLTSNHLTPLCTCCTHTFNGKVFGRNNS